MYILSQIDFVRFSRGKAATALWKMLEEGQNQPQIAHKRSKFQGIAEKGKEDVISALTDCLLLEILSRLPFTKDAITTSTLSKRWAHLWTFLPTLIFAYSDLPGRQAVENRSSYALLVDKTLTQCRQLKLKKFEVHTYYDIRFESQFMNWIGHAVSCNVEELNLEFWYHRREAEFRLDQSLFVSSYLTDLRLVGCMLNPSGAISWKNLRSLCISYLNLDEDLIVNILTGSPLLETLVLEYCCGYDWGDDVTSDDESEPESVEINASNTLSLAQCPQLKLKKFKVSTRYEIRFESQLNSWIRYAIRCNAQEFILIFWDTEPEYEFKLDQTIFTASCFTELKLNGCMINPVGAISWKNLRSLWISCGSLDEDLIKNILSGSPVLESLVLDGCYGYKRLDITSKSVKDLVISGCRIPREISENDTIEINAPNILSLTIQRNVFLWKFLLINVPSLVKDKFNFSCTKLDDRHKTPKETQEEILKGYIMSLGHVKELQIGHVCSKAVSRLQAQGFVFPSNVMFRGVVFENNYQEGALA